MSTKRLSRDQKRHSRQSTTSRGAPTVRQPSSGGTYKRPRFLIPLMQTEIGICEAYVAGGRRLTDREVAETLEELSGRLRTQRLPDVISEHYSSDETNAVVGYIRRRWRTLDDAGSLPASNNLLGILRTILVSSEVWQTCSGHSRGYLRYLEGFLAQAGFRVDSTSATAAHVACEDESLLAYGTAWLAGNADAQIEFQAEANECLGTGRADRVRDACRTLLIDQLPGAGERVILEQLIQRADQAALQAPHIT